MAQIHNLESKTRYGSRYVAGFIILISSILLAGWVAFFIFLPIKSSMEVVTTLEEKFLPRAEGMVLNFVSLSEPSTIITSDNQILDELHDGLNRDPIPLSEVPSFVVNTLLAAEDSNYYLHEGVDFVAILSAALDNLRGVTRGGSTITSQVAKQSFVGDEISVRRKVAEAVVAAELERRYTKDQILEYYINSIYWGSGAYGIQSASYEYFGKDIRDITLDEAATLVVIIRSPAYYNPRKYPDRVIERRNDVLNIMLKEGFIVDIQARSAKLAPLNVIDSVQIDSQAEHVVAEVKRQLLNDPQFAVLGSTNEERKKKIFGCPSDDTSCTGGGGLSVYITLNLEFQKHANQILNKWVPSENFDDENDEPKPTGVITLLNNLTGGIEVMASGIPFEEEQYNLATQGKRNPGSAFKPIPLLAALESGSKLYSYRDSRSPVEIDCGYPCAPDGVGTKWVVRNYGTSITADRYLNKIPAQDRAIELQCVGYHIEDIKNLDFIKQFPLVSNLEEIEDEEEKLIEIGRASLEEATRRSINTVFAQMASELGGEKLASTANRIGIDSDIDPVISLTLGAGAVTPIEIASAYSSFATNGVLAPPYLIERIEDSNGDVLYQNIVSQRTSIPDPGAAAAVRKTLEVAAQYGTGTRAVLDDRPIAGKTGTHQGFREAWFIGFIPQYTSSVWIGFAEEQLPLTDVEINGEVIRNVSGGRVPAPMWKEFMTKVVEDLPVVEWPSDPSDLQKYYEIPTVIIPELTGLNVIVAEEIAFSNYLLPNINLVDSEEAPGLVLSQSIEIDEEVPEGTVIELEVSGQKFSAPIPSIPPCQLLPEEAENLIKTYMRENNVILFLKKNFESSDIQGCKGKVIGTNVSQGATMSTGDTLIFIIDNTEDDS